MTQLNIQVKGLDKLQKAFKVAPTVVRREIGEGIEASMRTIEGEYPKSYSASGIGVISGFLKNRVLVKVDKKRLKGILTPKMDYSLYVHEGTRYMRGRPWLKKTVDRKEKEVQRIMQIYINKALKKVFK